MATPALAAALQQLKSGQAEQALILCRSALEQQPDNAPGVLLLASIQYRLGQMAATRESLARAAELFGNQVDGLLQVIQAYQRTGNPAEALSLLGRLPAGIAGAEALRGQLLWQSGRYDEALATFRDAVEVNPDAEEEHLRLARALIRFGRSDEIHQVLNAAQARFPGSEELARLCVLARLDDGEPPADVVEVMREKAVPGAAASTHHLCRALDVAAGRQSLDQPGYPFANDHESAAWESFDWLMRQNSNVRLFGSGTGVLRWAAQQAPAEGVFVECGVFHGFSLARLAEWGDREMHGFDSFEGLPEAWKPGEPAGSYSTHGRAPDLPAGVELHRGWFDQSLPAFARELDQPIALLHIDCDLYSSTVTVLEQLGGHLHRHAVIVFDDFLGFPGYREHEFRAAREFFESSGRALKPAAAVVLGRSVAFVNGRDQ